MPHTPQTDQPVQIVVAPELAEILAERHARRNAQAIAEGHGPIEDKSPFITRAELEKQHARRGRLTNVARLKIATRTQSNPSFERHARKCVICRHPEIESIESDFVNWRSENTIALNYQLPSRSCVFRHAAAVGLLERRRLNLRGVCERIIEHVDQAPPSGMAVLRALRIYAHITEEGHWVEPPKRSIVTHIHVTDHSPSRPDEGREFAGAPSSALSAEGGIERSEPSVLSGPRADGDHAQSDRQSALRSVSSELSRVGRGKQPKKVATGSGEFSEPREGSGPGGSSSPSADGDHAQEDRQTVLRSVPSELSRVGCGKQPKTIATECSHAVAETGPDLDYLPHWARGLYPDTLRTAASTHNRAEVAANPRGSNDFDASRTPEILIGTRSTSRGSTTNGKNRR